jgi:hypothetical protein
MVHHNAQHAVVHAVLPKARTWLGVRSSSRLAAIGSVVSLSKLQIQVFCIV